LVNVVSAKKESTVLLSTLPIARHTTKLWRNPCDAVKTGDED